VPRLSGQLVVFFVDECHLLWGDLCGYVWGKTDERIEVPIINERSKQTYYGAVNLSTQQCLIQAYKTGNSESTIAFLKYLLSQCRESNCTAGASYHRSDEVRAYLESVNQGLEPTKWKITCILLPMHQSRIRLRIFGCKENGCESVTIFAKTLVLSSFLFEFVTHLQTFDFPKLHTYGCFSQLI